MAENKYQNLIDEIETLGYRVKLLTQYHIRINNGLDLYPKNKKYHDIINNVRGVYNEDCLDDFLYQIFGEGVSNVSTSIEETNPLIALSDTLKKLCNEFDSNNVRLELESERGDLTIIYKPFKHEKN